MAKWDAGAAAYAGYMVSPAGRYRAALILETLGRHLPSPPLDVLEVGCGLGELACTLAERGYRVVAADPSREMIRQAAQRAATLPGEARVRLDLQPLEVGQVLAQYPPVSFDVLIAHTVLEYLPQAAETFAALLALLRRGGLVSLVQINQASKVLRAALNQLDFAAARAAVDDRTVLSDTFRLPARTATLTDILDLYRRNGLSVVGSYGIRVFPDYLPAEVRNDPARQEALLELERAACSAEPYRSMARYLHVIGVKA